MKFRTITKRIMATVLPVVVVSTILLTAISYIISSRIINTETTAKMMARLETELEKIEGELDNNAAIAQALVSYAESASAEDFLSGGYREFMFKIIPANSNTMGGGIWYEPYKLKSDLQYFGPYVYMENGSPVFTDVYEDPEYDYPSTDWYVNGKKSAGGIAWSDVYYDHVSEVTMLTGAQPFYDQDKRFLGTTTADMDATEIQRIVRSVQVGRTGRALLIGANGAYISSWDVAKTPEMFIADDSEAGLAALGRLFLTQASGTARLEHNQVGYQVYFKTMPGTGWRLAIVMEEDEIAAPVREMTVIMLAVTLGTLVIMFLAIISFTGYLRRNLSKITDCSRTAASGDFSNRIIIDSQDEFRFIAENLNSMLDDLDNMSCDCADMVQKSNRLVSEIEKSTVAVSTGSREIAEKTSQNAQIAREAADMMAAIKGGAEKGGRRMDNMMRAVQEMNEASGRIEKVIRVIEDIAFQTNVLALNASVEAARAGEHGKSFAVVAEEVRTLASKSAEAAQETKVLIENSVEKANLGLDIATETATSLKEIVDGINRSATIAAQIARVSDEQAEAIAQVNTGISQVTRVVQQNSAADRAV